MKLCKNLEVKKFPTVVIFRGGETSEKLGEILCKNTAVEDIAAEIDDLMMRSEK